LAAKISAATGLPWFAVDDLTWEPGWVQVPEDEQRRRIAAICQQDAWILDSAYGTWLDVPVARAQLIVGLDYARWRSLARLCRRTVMRLIDQQMICNGNRETLRNVFSMESLLLWHFRSYKRKQGRIRCWQADPKSPAVQRFRSPRELRLALPELDDRAPTRPSIPRY
jgi:adenylate kinase family enzyme